MAQIAILRSGGKPLFGGAVAEREKPAPHAQDPQDLAYELNERLREKYRNYERAAVRLELRGELDAAALLRQAAGKVRLLRNVPAADAPE